jgi:hypothetical protein
MCAVCHLFLGNLEQNYVLQVVYVIEGHAISTWPAEDLLEKYSARTVIKGTTAELERRRRRTDG